MAEHLLKCDGVKDCAETVTHLDHKGFVYCAKHGEYFRDPVYRKVRKLRPHELNRLKRGEQIARY